ncbi:hypothetical protein PACTADRAFT_224 [Pachysolen tannophilus NRRL Y-2460]|uniref:Fumarate reductase n=1 Tax=Pachysolen tannophilus NRRL Y-2460 TaxID=669874 RepID=A0A1E4U168_PACTA|nr:hypothetical protein PACTADRAFT_224 [Pachysolen tannophilus NRRL Y-2460]
MPSAVVVGSGFAGLSTTYHLLNNGFKVTLLEKTPVVGFHSNSNKASSGINGAETRFQRAQGVSDDSADLFYRDSLHSAKDSARPDLLKVLTFRSNEIIEWLSNDLQIDLSTVSQLGGHSKPRTHRGSSGLPPGYAIISQLVKFVKNQENLTVLSSSRAIKLLTDDGERKKIIGLEYQDESGTLSNPAITKKINTNVVVLATGGYSADFTSQNSLLSQYRRDLIKLPSTNGQQTTGDGIKLAADIGARLVDMDKVQLHPTGFVDPQDPNNKWKILAGEVLRGCGGILLNQHGHRFVDELQTRDLVAEAIRSSENSQVISHVTLVISGNSYNEIKTHLDFYISKGLVFKATLKELSERLNIPLLDLVHQLQSYNIHRLNKTPDEFGRTIFGEPFGIDADSIIYYGTITPVLHFTMGGVEIDEHSRVYDNNNEIIDGLYAVGEVSGGVHGANRLGGSSLLESGVFSKVASEDIIEKFS